MKGHSIGGKRGVAKRLVMPDAIRDKAGFQDRAITLTNWDLEESQDQYLVNSRLCINNNSNDGEPVHNLGARTSVQDNKNQRISLSTQSSDGFCLSPVATCESPNGLVYAGAKFNESPSPKVLPRPPLHWVGSPKVVDCGAIECVLKVMLRVQC